MTGDDHRASWLQSLLSHAARTAFTHAAGLKHFGPIGHLMLFVAPNLYRKASGRVLAVRIPGYRYPLHFRPGTSDPLAILQVFGRQEYGFAASLPGLRSMIDCGANIGCTTAFVLARHPKARAVVVEPDPGNMAVCRLNLAPFADRVTFVEAGVWSRATGLVVDRATNAAAGEWAIQVRPTGPGEPADCRAVTIGELAALGGFGAIDFLKVDIEGSEAEVFGPGHEGWLPRARTVAVEFHGPRCEEVVVRAVSRFPHARARSGELTVFRFDATPANAPR